MDENHGASWTSFELAPQLYEACITVAAENPYM
jgi:hypothetical protein